MPKLNLALRLAAVAAVVLFFGCSNEAQVIPPTGAQILSQLSSTMADVTTLFNTLRGVPITGLSPQDARQQVSAEDAAKFVARRAGTAQAPQPVGKVTDGLTIPGPDGNVIPIRLYAPAGTGPFPVTLYFHGGGFVIATIDTYDASARALCVGANTMVVSVEYRKAPEAPFPAAYRDAVASDQWILSNIASYNGNSAKVAVAGESAGGNLATEVALAAHSVGLQTPTAQVLIYPVTSSNLSQSSDLLYTDASLPLNTAGLSYFLKLYVPNSSDQNNPNAAPINAILTNLPPTTIIAAQFDPLVSDGQAYQAKLQAAGNKVTYMMFPGTTHEFFGMGAYVDQAKGAEQFAASALTASFQ